MSSDAGSLPARTPDYNFSLFQRRGRSPSVVRALRTLTCSQCDADARSSSTSMTLARRSCQRRTVNRALEPSDVTAKPVQSRTRLEYPVGKRIKIPT